MNKNHEAKAVVVEQIRQDLSNAKAAILVDYRGLTVEEDTALRRNLRQAGVKYQVLKNTLIKRAADMLGEEALDPYLNGPTAVAFSFDDPVAPAKIVNDCIKSTKKMEMKAGFVEGKFCDAKELAAIAELPSKEMLIAKILGSFNAPICNFLYCLTAIKDKKEAEGASA